MSIKNTERLNQKLKNRDEVNDEFTTEMLCFPRLIQHKNYYYENETLGLSLGICDCATKSEITFSNACDEFIIMIEGSVTIENNKTCDVETIMTGESFVLPQGFDYQWRQLGDLRMFYIHFEAKAVPDLTTEKNIIHINEKHQLTEDSSIPWQQTSDGHRKKVFYQNHNKGFTYGLWQGDAFSTEMITFPYNEFIHIIHGSLICRDNQGIEHTLTLGDAVFIPQGTRCAWQVNDQVTISFVQIV